MTGPVVCGVDISESARSVVDTARWLAEGVGSHLIVVHAAEEPSSEAEEFATNVHNRLGAADHEVRLAEGAPAEALVHAVAAEHAEYVVVGSRGQTALRAGMFGSVSRAVSARSPAPVVVVPPRISGAPEADREQRSVVCGVDGSEHALRAVRVAGRLARDLDCRLLLVHAVPDIPATASYLGARATNPPLSGQSDARAQRAAQIVADAVDSVDADAIGVVEVGAPWEVLEHVAERESGWLVVIAARGRGAVTTARFGSVAARLATSARRPVVMIPELAETR